MKLRTSYFPKQTLVFSGLILLLGNCSLLSAETQKGYQESQKKILAVKLSTNKIEKLILEYTNQERKKFNLRPVSHHRELAITADKHSQNMIEYDFFAHNDHLNRTPADRFHHWFPHFIGLTGENLAKFEGLVADTNQSLAKKMVKGWMNSLPHRKNILNKKYSQLGVGVKIHGRICVATQNFGILIGKLMKIPPKKILYGEKVAVEMEFFDLFPRSDLKIFLVVPDQKKKFFLHDGKRYYTGIMPLKINWIKNRSRLRVKIPFVSGVGTYQLQFGKTDQQLFPYSFQMNAQ